MDLSQETKSDGVKIFIKEEDGKENGERNTAIELLISRHQLISYIMSSDSDTTAFPSKPIAERTVEARRFRKTETKSAQDTSKLSLYGNRPMADVSKAAQQTAIMESTEVKLAP